MELTLRSAPAEKKGPGTRREAQIQKIFENFHLPPPKSIKKRLSTIFKIPQKDQQTIARIIDGLASQHGIVAPK